MSAPSPLLKALTLGLLTLIWGTTWAAITISLRGIPPFTGVALRFAIAAVLLLAYCRLMGISLAATSNRDRRLRIVHALLSFCVSYGVVFWAEQWVPSGLASVLFATFPLMVAVLAHFVLSEERMTAPVMMGIVLGFTGIAVIFAEDFDLLGGRMVAVAAAVMLFSPMAAAVVSVAVKRWGAGVHPVPFNAVAMTLSAGIMGGVAFAAERHRPMALDPGPVAALFYMAIAGTAITFPLSVFMNESLTPRTLVGSALVVVGVAVASHAKRRRGGRMSS